MRKVGIFLILLTSQFAGTTLAADKPAEAKVTAEKRFNDLLDKAKADPSRTNWKSLRLAYTETDRYQPYGRDWRENLAQVHADLDKGDLKEAEKKISALRDKEGWTRLDVLMTAENIYDKLGDKKAEELHHRFIEGYLMTIMQAGRGQSAAKPFDVIYIDEEYLILHLLDEKRQSQALIKEGTHFIDVQTTEPKGHKPAGKYYFNVDLPRKQLERMLKPAIEKAKAKTTKATEAAPAQK